MEKETSNQVYSKLVRDFTDGSINEVITFFPCEYILRCVDGRYEGRQVLMKSIGDEIIIGSSEDCNFQINDTEISAKHAQFTYIEDSIYYELKDLGSENGTWIKILSFEEYEITSSTEFKFNSNVFIIQFDEEKDIHQIIFTEGKFKDQKMEIENNSDIIVGVSFPYVEPFSSDTGSYRILKSEKKVYVSVYNDEVNSEGMYMRINPNDFFLVRAGDHFKIGKNTFRIISHNWGWTNEIGDRTNQEDKFCIVDDLRISNDFIIPFYSVFDGHGGSTCSNYLQKHFHHNIRNLIKLDSKLLTSNNFIKDFCNIIQNAIIYTDFAFKKEEESFSKFQGSTCIALFFIGNKIISANLGDSLSILVKNKKKIYLSKDLKPSREMEKERINYLKGVVEEDGRIYGVINVSRAFGDWNFKEPSQSLVLKSKTIYDMKDYIISNRAEFRIYEIDPQEDKYAILASDGIFQYPFTVSVFDTLEKHLRKEKEGELKNIPKVIDNLRVDLVNSTPDKLEKSKEKMDNMTLVFISLNNNMKNI